MSDFLLPSELAKRWRINPQTLANWRSCTRADPTCPSGPEWVTIGTKILYSLEAVENYERENNVLQGNTDRLPRSEAGTSDD